MKSFNLKVNRIAIVFAISLLGAVLWFSFRIPEHKITIINEASNSVDILTVVVCKNDYIFKSILPGASASKVFLITGDSGFLVHGKFSNGNTIAGNFGYVTGSYSEQIVTIVLHDDGTIIGKQ